MDHAVFKKNFGWCCCSCLEKKIANLSSYIRHVAGSKVCLLYYLILHYMEGRRGGEGGERQNGKMEDIEICTYAILVTLVT